MIYLLLLSALLILAHRHRPIPSSEIQGCDLVKVLKGGEG
jgi:hypothetical protein